MSPHASPTRIIKDARVGDIVDALCDAFHDYAVMRHIIGDAGDDYDRRLNLLIGFFVSRRVAQNHPILAIEDAGRIVAVATLTPPGAPWGPPEDPRREALWAELGPEARARSESLVAVWTRLEIPGPQFHLNMLGVRRSHAGRGLGRRLLDSVHEMSRTHPESEGVSLSTEDPRNVPLYLHCGYEIRFHERVGDGLETWIFFRPDSVA